MTGETYPSTIRESARTDLEAPPPITVGEDELRLLRDGFVAHAAMLAAIHLAEREVLLEMYWVGDDHVGAAFLAALVERARRGVSVCVVYDAFGSIGLPATFWSSLVAAGGRVRRFSPISLFRRRFRFARLLRRDHRKNLVVDGIVGFAGGINLGAAWAPLEGVPWRDDAVEVRGPAARMVRIAFYRVWKRLGEEVPGDVDLTQTAAHGNVQVLTNEISGRPNRVIRRTYLMCVRRATSSICIASAYFLPGPLFLHALRRAAKRGVRVRVLVPDHSDVAIVKLAMGSLFGRLLEDGVEIYAYLPGILHSKTAVFDDRIAMVGSHNLDVLSWRFNLECNVVVVDPTFATLARESFDVDCSNGRPVLLSEWRRRSLLVRLVAWFAALLRPLL